MSTVYQSICMALGLAVISSSAAQAEESLRPLDTRTRCIVLLRECLVSFEKKDLDRIFQNVADTAGPRFFIFSDPGSDSPDAMPEIEDTARFFKKSRAEQLTYRTFNQIQFSDLVTAKEPISITNKTTGREHKAKFHTLKIKIPMTDGHEIVNLRFVQIAERIYWIPFKW